jgi:hypothetical protein
MPKSGLSGSVRGAPSNGRPYRDTLSKPQMSRSTRQRYRGRRTRLGEMSEDDAQSLHRGTGGSTYTRKARNTGSPKARSGMTNQTPVRERLGAVGWRRGL